MVKLNTDQPGLSGLGDASPMQNDAEVMSFVEELTARYLVGKDPLDSGVLHNVLYMDQQARGGRIATTALSGIDMALWDLKGKILDQPVYRLLGGAHRTRIRNADEAKVVVDMGYTALKFDPFGQRNYYTISLSEAQLAQDRVAAVRNAVGPEVDILVEAHAKFNVAHCHSTRQADGGVPAALL
ncbi:D-gluconate dehydratase [Geodia barretti]|uniref:D-gluconate dehydratase n=1 Tax=Geodia barretti TaxID=519541 RepID=A0AA35T389_GEOBA|nr:D-gluconate dehydratase [Geodia barretti]